LLLLLSILKNYNSSTVSPLRLVLFLIEFN
jgi:hypothetical protein